jgi:hypothetical protein
MVLMTGCSSASTSGSGGASDPGRQDELVAAAKALGPVTQGWTAIETSSICDGQSCTDPSIDFVSRRKGGSPQKVCAEAVPWVSRSFGVTATVEDCVRAMNAPADPSTTQPGFQWEVGAPVAQVAGSTATWQVLVYADSVDFGDAGSGAAGVPVSYQAGGYLYDGDRAADIARFTGVSPAPS